MNTIRAELNAPQYNYTTLRSVCHPAYEDSVFFSNRLRSFWLKLYLLLHSTTSRG